MPYSPVLIAHIAGGTLGLASGFGAMFLRKGSERHRATGQVFVVSMLTLAGTGVYMAILKSQPGNILGGTVTIYLVTTAWMISRRRERQTTKSDWIAFLFAATVGGFALTSGVQAVLSPSGLKYGFPAWPYFFMGGVISLAALGDLRMLLRGGVSGPQRIARHLWRMSFALFIAAMSLFIARQHLFPEILRRTGALVLLSFSPLILMTYWLIRTLHKKRSALQLPRPAIGAAHD